MNHDLEANFQLSNYLINVTIFLQLNMMILLY
jgi:hypothetical protein